MVGHLDLWPEDVLVVDVLQLCRGLLERALEQACRVRVVFPIIGHTVLVQKLVHKALDPKKVGKDRMHSVYIHLIFCLSGMYEKEIMMNIHEKMYTSTKSIVYRGVWKDRPVAIKQIPRRYCVMDPCGRSMESKVLQQLQGCHHVVQYYHTVYDTDDIYIVMEWVYGQQLKYLEKPLAEKKVRFLVHQIATFLHCCSRKNMIYADMKPENILLDATGRIRIVDFGCTRHVDDVPECYMGTPIYFPPEMFDKILLPEHDVWGLGVLAYFLACGRHPFLAADPKDFSSLDFSTVEHGILHQPLTFHHAVWNEWSPEGISFLQRLLEKDPEQRPTISRVLQLPWLNPTV